MTEEHVRRLLAEARHTEPTPDAVVARLDRVLADLADEPARSATVVRLADRRRRAAAVLVAAAASVAAIIGVGQVVPLGGGTDGPEAISAEDDAGADADAPAAEAEGGVESGSQPPFYGSSDRSMPFRLQARRFARDARALKSTAATLDEFSAYSYDQDDLAEELADGTSLNRAQGRIVCETGAWGTGRYVAVVYDGAEGWVVLRRPRGDTQIVDLFLCGSEAAVRSVTLPYP